jgi:hypothetical protein
VSEVGRSNLGVPAAADELDLAFWSSVKDSYWREELQAYLDQHPSGHFTVQRGHGRVVIDEDLSDLEVNQPPASGV